MEYVLNAQADSGMSELRIYEFDSGLLDTELLECIKHTGHPAWTC